MEIIDSLFIFWFALAVGVYAIGTIYQKQQEEAKSKRKLEQRRKSHNETRNNYSNSTDFYSRQTASHILDSDYQAHRYNTNQNQSSSVYGSHHKRESRANNDILSYGQGQNEITKSLYDRQDIDALVRDSHARKDFTMSPIGSAGLTRESPGQYQQNENPLQFIPTATGFNEGCVDWVNSILSLFFSQSNKYAPQIADSIYRSLNEKLSSITGSSTDCNDLVVEFTGIRRELSTGPELTNIRTELESEKSVSANCKLYIKRMVLDLDVYKQQSVAYISSLDSSDGKSSYELTLENLEGKLKTMAMVNEKLIVIQFLEKPDTKILLRQKSLPNANLGVSQDALVSIILQAITQVVVDLYFGDDLEFPQFKPQQLPTSLGSTYKSKLNALKGSASEIKRQIKHDFFGALASSDHKERKVFIKILKANNLNYNQDVTCILELDQPYQQAISSTQKGSSPFWDEHYLLNVTDKSSELTLELWDSINCPVTAQDSSNVPHHKRTKSVSSQNSNSLSGYQKNQTKFNKAELTANGKLIGFARVSVDELRKNSVLKVTLNLKSQGSIGDQNSSSLIVAPSATSDSYAGELQVEFLFMEHSSGSPSNLSSGHRMQKSGSVNSLAHLNQGDVVSIDRKLTSSGYVITTTTIMKPHALNPRQNQKNKDKLSLTRNQSPTSEQISDFDRESNLDAVSSRVGTPLEAVTPTTDLDSGPFEERGRSRSRSRSLLRAIKKRFSFSRNRSRSVGETRPSSPTDSKRSNQQLQTNLDTLSIESRSRGSSSEISTSGYRAKSVPVQRDLNEVPAIVINKSRLSDTASAFTFLHPKSQLVIECQEPRLNEDGSSSSKQNGRLRYYAISDDAANKRKWRKRGVKLHLFNEHQFVACHLAGSSTCHLCGRVFSRRPGKQGYKCRNCHLLSHKECHVKVDHNCPYATREGLALEYIDADPPASLIMEREIVSSGESSTLPGRKGTPRMQNKSISMEVDDR